MVDVLRYQFRRERPEAGRPLDIKDRFEIEIANLNEDDATAVLMFIDRLQNARRDAPEPLATYKQITGQLRVAS